MRRVAGLFLAVALGGCGPVGVGPAYTEEEQTQVCALRGGWWRPDELRGGHCEFEAAGFM